MQHVAVVVAANTQIGLRCEVVALFKGVDKHINEGIHHEQTEKSNGGQ